LQLQDGSVTKAQTEKWLKRHFYHDYYTW